MDYQEPNLIDLDDREAPALPSDEYRTLRLLENAGYPLSTLHGSVHLLVLELLEARRLHNEGLRFDISSVAKEKLCIRCELGEDQHEVRTVQCQGYEPEN